jgi:hypothetical protein
MDYRQVPESAFTNFGFEALRRANEARAVAEAEQSRSVVADQQFAESLANISGGALGSSARPFASLQLGPVNIRSQTGEIPYWTLTLPAGAGNAGDVLYTDGNGKTSWGPAGRLVTIDASTSQTLAGASFVRADSTNGNVILTLPRAEDNIGQVYIVFRMNLNGNDISVRPSTDALNGLLNMQVNLPEPGMFVHLIAVGSLGWQVLAGEPTVPVTMF